MALQRQRRHLLKDLSPAEPDEQPGTKLFSLGTTKRSSDEALDEVLALASLSNDSELSVVLHQVNEVCNSLKSDHFNQKILSDVLLLAIRSAVKRSLLERELSIALTDDLTGLHNRRGFVNLATHQLKMARRGSHGMLLFFADVNNLKEINDTYGHREGDLALIRAADALAETFRDSDILARFGGDEFAILALETSSEDRDVILARLEESLSKSNARESRYSVSLSVGIARFDPLQPILLDELIVKADQAMYDHKRAGRNLLRTD